MPNPYDIAAYIWPAYSGKEPRSRIFWPEGIGEWQTVKRASAKFEGHEWPRKPLWGYCDEADPAVMAQQIDAAADHGVNVFIYDWYWYDDRPFQEQCLNDGFLEAPNRSRMKFYLMWANHDANYLWDIRNSSAFGDTVVWRGAVTRAQFEPMAKRLIQKYFHLPEYYTIEGKPVFMIYDVQNLLNGFGGMEATKDALCWWKREAVRQGLPGIHLQLALQGGNEFNLSGVDGGPKGDMFEILTRLPFDSASHYQFVHFTNIDRTYEQIIPDVVREWEKMRQYPIPYFPHVSIGWDNNPRFADFRPGIIRDNTPQQVEKLLQSARDYMDCHTQTKLLTINSWNEWTESSYLQPDDRYGYGYLEAVRHVFLEGK